MRKKSTPLFKNIYFLILLFFLISLGVYFSFSLKPVQAEFNIAEPELSNSYTHQDKLEFLSKGYQAVFFNSEFHKIRGLRTQSLPIEYGNYGLYRFHLSAYSKKNEPKHYQVHRLYVPSTLSQYNLNAKEALFFISRYLDSSFYEVLDKPVTRLQFAYFLDQLAGPERHTQRKRVFKDFAKYENFYEQANRAVNNQWLFSLPKAFFYPDKYMTKQDMILALVKVLNLSLKNNSLPNPALEILNAYHWTFPYIKAAYTAGLLQDSDLISLNNSVSQADFVRIISSISKIEEELETLLLTFKEPVSALAHQTALNQHLTKKNSHHSTKINLTEMPEGLFIQGFSFDLKGNIKNPNQKYVLVNKNKIQLKADLSFETTVSLTVGHNTILIESGPVIKTVDLYVLPKLSYYQSHWSLPALKRLIALGLIDETSIKLPNARLSRADFSVFLARALNLKNEGKVELPFQDVSPHHPWYKEVKLLYQNEILKGNGSYFLPQKSLSKIEALVAIMRADQEKVRLSDLKLPYQDIDTRFEWAIPYIQQALKAKLISEAQYFYPNKVITFSEFVTLLYRSKNVQRILRSLDETQT